MIRLKEYNFKKINFILILLIAFFIPLSKAIIPILIVVSLVISFFNSSFLSNLKIAYYRNNALLLISFYLIISLSLFWSGNIKSGLFDMEVKLSMFLFPIIFLNYGTIKIDEFKHVIHYFIAGNILESLICLSSATYNSLQSNNSYFYYSNFSENLHPSYFAMYLTFAIAGCIYLLKNNYYKKVFYPIIFISFFLVIIFFLSSKAGFLGVALMLPFFIIKLINKRLISLIIAGFGVVIIIAFIYKFNSRVSDFIKEFKTSYNNDTINVYDTSTSDRFKIYKISLSLINENLVYGVGAGDIKDKLIKKYSENNMKHAAEQKLNLHNQYLETLIGEGIIGFIFMMLLFLYPLIYVFKKSNFLLYSFLLITAFHFLFESMLNTQSGVIYFAFFFCFLNFVNKNNDDKVLAPTN
ncbi:MAG: hypothetical protein A2046_14080 [Bacteroidetes bacterium GWA2_30_7]|nr:MAG: hypothetical protein A2046_14080 [Bacteroidetes bacterium GWA2_30_7]